MEKQKVRFSMVSVLLLSIYLPIYGQARSEGSKNVTNIKHPVTQLEVIIARMEQSRIESRARTRAHTVVRNYKLFSKDRTTEKAQVIAEVTFLPPGSKLFTIQQTSGSKHGEGIVRRILEKETQLAKNSQTTDISRKNYDFQLVREEAINGQRCYVLELRPKRKDKNLIRGHVWVNADTYLIHRIEGQPVKNPSWWVKDVRFTLHYANVDGMWLQTASEATANVRLLGHHTMVSHDVKYKMNEVASAKPAKLSQREAK